MHQFLSRTITVFSLLFLAGFILANNIIIMVSIIPLAFAACAYYLKPPNNVIVDKRILKQRMNVGETLEVEVRAYVESGMGAFEICDVIPKHFELVEGSNFHVFWKGVEPLEAHFVYKIRSVASGVYPMKFTNWKGIHSICDYTVNGRVENKFTIKVIPRLLELKKVRGINLASNIPMPQGAVSSMGMDTMEFKEIRLYTPGDPFKSINWKVTSRNLSRGNVWPVINKFEKEGKKTVGIFMEFSPTMNYGSKIKNVKEYAVEAVNALSDFYIKEGCSVGLQTFGSKDIFIPFGSGRGQYHKILKELMNIKNYNDGVTNRFLKNTEFRKAVEKRKLHFANTRPLFVIVARFYANNIKEISSGLEVMKKYTLNKNGKPGIMLVNIIGYELMAENETEKYAANLLEAVNKAMSKDLRKNCLWVDWNPAKESLTNALIKQVVKSR